LEFTAMTRIATAANLAALSLFAATTLGCATATTATLDPGAAAGLSCGELRAQIADTEAARRTALEKEQNAWKVVIPFAVAARYATSKSAVKEADEQLAQLHAESIRQGCGVHG
jgi:hypothetical protein